MFVSPKQIPPTHTITHRDTHNPHPTLPAGAAPNPTPTETLISMLGGGCGGIVRVPVALASGILRVTLDRW